MGKTTKRDRTEPEELLHGNVPPEHVIDNERRERGLVYRDLLYFALHFPPQKWAQWTIDELARRCVKGKPWRPAAGYGCGMIEDWGALPGTVAGQCRRFYFIAFGGKRRAMAGEVVANDARAVKRWLRDEHRAYACGRDERPVVSDDVLLLWPFTERGRTARSGQGNASE